MDIVHVHLAGMSGSFEAIRRKKHRFAFTAEDFLTSLNLQ